MKKVLIAVIPIIALTFIVLSTTQPRAFAQRPWHLYGLVTYNGDGDVGSGRPVEIYEDSITTEDPPIAYTDGNGWYDWGFTGSQYFYKVRCQFRDMYGTLWVGETIINQVLSGSYRADIIVYQQ